MKHFLKFCLSLSLILFITACENKGSDSIEETQSEAQTTEAQEAAVDTKDLSGISDENSRDVLNAYLEIKDALVATNAEQAKAAANKMLASLAEAESTQAIKGIKEDAQHIVDADEMEHMREHFDLMSQNIYDLAKAKDTGMTLYKQFCPMAFDNKGAFWLSASEEIRNPYFGDKMLKCGAVKETIASK